MLPVAREWSSASRESRWKRYRLYLPLCLLPILLFRLAFPAPRQPALLHSSHVSPVSSSLTAASLIDAVHVVFDEPSRSTTMDIRLACDAEGVDRHRQDGDVIVSVERVLLDVVERRWVLDGPCGAVQWLSDDSVFPGTTYDYVVVETATSTAAEALLHSWSDRRLREARMSGKRNGGGFGGDGINDKGKGDKAHLDDEHTYVPKNADELRSQMEDERRGSGEQDRGSQNGNENNNKKNNNNNNNDYGDMWTTGRGAEDEWHVPSRNLFTLGGSMDGLHIALHHLFLTTPDDVEQRATWEEHRARKYPNIAKTYLGIPLDYHVLHKQLHGVEVVVAVDPKCNESIGDVELFARTEFRYFHRLAVMAGGLFAPVKEYRIVVHPDGKLPHENDLGLEYGCGEVQHALEGIGEKQAHEIGHAWIGSLIRFVGNSKESKRDVWAIEGLCHLYGILALDPETAHFFIDVEDMRYYRRMATERRDLALTALPGLGDSHSYSYYVKGGLFFLHLHQLLVKEQGGGQGIHGVVAHLLRTRMIISLDDEHLRLTSETLLSEIIAVTGVDVTPLWETYVWASDDDKAQTPPIPVDTSREAIREAIRWLPDPNGDEMVGHPFLGDELDKARRRVTV